MVCDWRVVAHFQIDLWCEGGNWMIVFSVGLLIFSLFLGILNTYGRYGLLYMFYLHSLITSSQWNGLNPFYQCMYYRSLVFQKVIWIPVMVLVHMCSCSLLFRAIEWKHHHREDLQCQKMEFCSLLRFDCEFDIFGINVGQKFLYIVLVKDH